MRACSLFFGIVLLQALALAQPKKILYVTHSAGFRHDCLPLSQDVLREIGTRSGKLEVTATEDLSLLTDLSPYSAVAFYTSGELALSDAQKQGLLTFVRNGGGFAGFHSATDTLYAWPEYGELIGARFESHPWTEEVRIDIEDPDHPTTRALAPSFRILDEIYQFREFSRTRSRVLMTLDEEGDFPLAWTHLYGSGRVFYNALGHFDSTWRDARFQQMLEQGLLWVTGQVEAEGAPRVAQSPSIAANGIGNAATMQPPLTISPGSFASIYGASLTSGATMAADIRTASHRLAGTRIRLNGAPVPVIFASPGQINFLAPLDLNEGSVDLIVETPTTPSARAPIAVAPTTPGLFTTTIGEGYATLWVTGLGAVSADSRTILTPNVTVNETPASITYSGLAPGWPGLYQVNIQLPAGVTPPFQFQLTSGPPPQ